MELEDIIGESIYSKPFEVDGWDDKTGDGSDASNEESDAHESQNPTKNDWKDEFNVPRNRFQVKELEFCQRLAKRQELSDLPDNCKQYLKTID